MSTTRKRCSQCKKVKSTSEFHRNNQQKDGLHPSCKSCRSAHAAKSYYRDIAKSRDSSLRGYYKRRETILAQQRRAYAANPEAKLAKNREWAKRNPDKTKEIQKRHYEKHGDARRRSTKHWQQSHLTERREYERQRRQQNPSFGHVKNQRRVARKRSLPSTFKMADWNRALAYFNGRCAVCGRPPGLWHTLAQAHWIPLSKGGGYTPDNIVPLCHGVDGCNNSQCNKLPEEWLIQRYGKRKASAIQRRIEAYLEWTKKH